MLAEARTQVRTILETGRREVEHLKSGARAEVDAQKREVANREAAVEKREAAMRKHAAELRALAEQRPRSLPGRTKRLAARF
jgi:hypothetical protein